MSQERLGEAIGLTFQQVQKYERGSNRISAGTLYRLSQVLGVPVSFFFDSYDDPHAQSGAVAAALPEGDGDGAISRREARLLRLWRAAPPAVADELLALLSALSPALGDGREEEVATTPAATSPLRIVSRGDGAAPRGRRRRHGAVWDPADIYRTGKTDA